MSSHSAIARQGILTLKLYFLSLDCNQKGSFLFNQISIWTFQ
jgi:hypothetical protein